MKIIENLSSKEMKPVESRVLQCKETGWVESIAMEKKIAGWKTLQCEETSPV